MTTTTPIAGNYTDNAAVAQRLKHAAIDSLHSFRPGTGPLTVAPVSDELDPVMEDFVANLKPINERADSAHGFVWRFQTEQGDATAERPYDDDRLIINFSVWEDFDSLRDFVYRSAHAGILKRRREWFERLTDAYLVLWWVPVAHRPTIPEAMARLECLKRHGPSPEAFTFRHFYLVPDVSNGQVAPPVDRGN